MGTGKSSVGNFLARMFHFQFRDTDELIEARAGKRISEIFAQEGEARFRAYEREVVAELEACQRTVFATGGGLAVHAPNMASLKRHSLVVCLWASPEVIWSRVRHQTHRPLLSGPDGLERIRQLLAEREPAYKQADVLINTEMRSVREVALHVAHQYRVATKNPATA